MAAQPHSGVAHRRRERRLKLVLINSKIKPTEEISADGEERERERQGRMTSFTTSPYLLPSSPLLSLSLSLFLLPIFRSSLSLSLSLSLSPKSGENEDSAASAHGGGDEN